MSTRRFLFLCLLVVAAISPLPSGGQVVISEFMADNKSNLADEDGQYPDWIELYNPTGSSVNLASWSLTEDPTHQTRWTFPATNITAKGFLVVFASGKNRTTPGHPLHTDFSLKASGQYLALVTPGGTVATEFTPAFPPQYANYSYGLAQDVTTNVVLSAGAPGRYLVPSDGSLGNTWTQPGFDDTAWSAGPSSLGYETAVAGFAVYNYVGAVGVCSLSAAQELLSNPSQQSAVFAENATVINYLNTTDSAHFGQDRTFPGLTIGVDQDNFAIHATATVHIPAPGPWTFGVNSDDGFLLSVGDFSMSYPDPRGPDDTFQTFNFPTAGDYPIDLVFYECGGGSEVEVFAAPGALSGWDANAFQLVGDVAKGGLAVTAPVVSGSTSSLSYRSLFQTDVQDRMVGRNASAYLRVPFTVPDPSALRSLTLRVQYDDGFVAYLNGQEVARRNAPSTVSWNSSASTSHPNFQGITPEEINLSGNLGLLQPGQNVLAVQALNQSATDTDFLIVPQFVEYQVNSTTNKYFATPTPGALNNNGFIAFVEDTKFSVGRGFYDAPIHVEITTATPDAKILYTTNGSTPSPSNGTVYTGPLEISQTTVLRAAAFKDGFQPSNVDTESYLFVGDVIHQSPTGSAPPGWPASWGANTVDYGMDPNVVNDPAYSGEIANDLKSIPTYSIVTDFKNLFDPATGIYANPSGDGKEWERPASIEVIYPDGTKGFHVNAGLRIRGGYSRSTGNPKHAFRFFFREEYGAAKLNYPAFAHQDGTESFDGFDLRTSENYSWSFEGDYRFIAVTDQFTRDTQLAQGQQGERGDFYHLFINGQYWGLYNTAERPEASFGASYFGGNKDDYDVIKVDTGAGYTIFATDGNMDAWTRLWKAGTNGFATDDAYFKVQGKNVDGTINPAYENLLDVDNLIDYMLVIFFTGNIDAPISAFLGNSNPNNMYAIRNRTGQFGGFRFVAHDSEHTLLHESSLGNNDELHRDRTGPFAAGDPVQQGAATALARSNPQYLFTRLMANPEFRLRVADHVQKQFFNGGVLTTEACRQRFLMRSNEVYGAIACESARWGDAKREPPRTRNVDWVKEVNRVYGDYFAQRPGIVLNQLKTKGLYPTVAAPTFSQSAGLVTNGYLLTLSAPVGKIYYTRDGSDPRLRGGALSPNAIEATGPISLTQSGVFKARVLSGGTWSALVDATLYVEQQFTDLALTEIMYHAPGSNTQSGDAFDFLELKNVGNSSLELSGIHFTSGIQYTFPIGSFVAPGQFIILASDAEAFAQRYPGMHADGVYTNSLSNSGETLTLVHASGAPIFSVGYGTRPPWPELADGSGFSIVPVNPNGSPNPEDPSTWRASSSVGGSPGRDDLPSDLPKIVLNEVLTHTDPPQVDSVEIYNPNPTSADVSGWYLTDDRVVPQKYRIPTGTIISPQGYLVLTENQWNADPNATNSFRLDSHGEQIYLFSASSDGTLTGYSDGFSFGAAENGVTFGRYVTSTGEIQYPSQKQATLGQPNSGPRVGAVVINEINYHPATGQDEFIELKSTTNSVVPLYDVLYPTNTYRLSGVSFDFPTGVEIPANGLLLVVGIDPTVFRSKYGVPANVPILGPYPGRLQGGGELLSLQSPDHPDVNTNTGKIFVPYIDLDVVHYDQTAPWPTNAAGGGSSLERLDPKAYGNDPVNWRASLGSPSPGLENNGNRAPVVQVGTDLSLRENSFPAAVHLSGTVRDDGLPDPSVPLRISWSQASGPGPVWFDDASQPSATAYFPGVGTYVLRLTASDGLLNTSADLNVTIDREASVVALTLASKGSIWKYLDDGSDQGASWSQPGFDDTAWKSGPAPLGYGDANGDLPATTVGYGPNANNKFITTYFRQTFTTPGAAFTNLVVNVQRDDGVLVYLNGYPIFTNNLPEGPIGYRTAALTAVGGTDETTFYAQAVDPVRLNVGQNVLAAEIHQAGGTSSDIIFDLELTGDALSENRPPLVNAGPDQDILLPANAQLNGTVQDDGLPVPPGMLTFGWKQVSGPGTVLFSNSTSLRTDATFPMEGSYLLRLTAGDGTLSTSDDIAVTVTGTQAPSIQIDSVVVAGEALKIVFNAQAGRSYTVEYQDTLSIGAWTKLTSIPQGSVSQAIEVTDPSVRTVPTRYYRIVSP